MNNPYESPKGPTRTMTQSPVWYVWFYKTYMPLWWIGTTLIACSWFGIVSTTVGWIGFTISAATLAGSYVLPKLAGARHEEHVFLDSRILGARGDAYRNAIERFRDGATLTFDGVAFGFRPENQIACGVIADQVPLEEDAAREIAEHARSVFAVLKADCPEFGSAVEGQTFRISIMSGNDTKARELCRIVGHEFDWNPP